MTDTAVTLRRMSESGERHPTFRVLLALAPAIVVLLAYLPTLTNGPITDDRPLILDNPFVLDAHGLWTLVTDDLWHASAAHQHTQYYRPLVMASFWLQARIGTSIAWLRAGNIVLFAATALLLSRLLSTEARNAGPTARTTLVCLWALHPLQSEAVIWISGRFDVALLLGCVTALLANTARHRALSTPIALFASLLCKEVAVVLLPTLMVHDLSKGRPWRQEATKYIGTVVSLATYVSLRSLVGVATGSAVASISLGTWVLSFATMLGNYARLMVWPTALDVHRWYEPLPLPVAAIVLGGAAVVVGLVFRRCAHGQRAGATGVFLAFSSLLPVSLIGPNQLIYGDRFSSLFVLGIAWALAECYAPSTRPTRRVLAATLLLLGEAWFTYGRGRAWQDESTLMHRALLQSPRNVHWRVLQAHALLAKDDPGAATAVLRAALLDAPNYPKTNNALCVASLRSHSVEEANRHCRAALRLDRGNPTIWVNNASVALSLQRWREASSYAEHALALRTPYPEAEFVLAAALANLGRETEARSHVDLGLRQEPGHAGLRSLDAQLRTHGY